MLVAVEGMDGSGKTTISKIVAQNLNYEYLEKPIQKFFSLSSIQFEKICERIYLSNDENVKAWFFRLGNLLASINKGQNIIIDKNLLSTFFWNCTSDNEAIFEALIDIGVVPDLTILLYASIESRYNHIKKRNENDKDLEDYKKMSFGYDKMVYFAEKYNIPYIFVNGDNFEFNNLVKYIAYLIKRVENMNSLQIQEFCKTKNNDILLQNDKGYNLCLKYRRTDYNEN